MKKIFMFLIILILIGCSDSLSEPPLVVDDVIVDEVIIDAPEEPETEPEIEESQVDVVEESETEIETEMETEPEPEQTTEESVPEEEAAEPVTIPLSYFDMVNAINFDSVPSSLAGVRFFNDSSRPVSFTVPNDGRTYPIGAFKAYYVGERTINIDIDSDRVINWYEEVYPLVYRIAFTIGQLPYDVQETITSIVINKSQYNPLTLNNGQLSVGEGELENIIQQNQLFLELLKITDPLSLVELEQWEEQRQLDEFSPSERSLESPKDDLEESFWALIYHQQSGLEDTNVLSKLAKRQENLELQIGFITPNYISSLSSPSQLPNHDTMNISTNMIYSTLIEPSDPSFLTEVTYIETALRYPTRTLYYREGTEPFEVHIYRAVYSNGHEMNFNIDTAFTLEEAKSEAEKIAYMYGQVPGLLLVGMDDFVLFRGEGHPSSGRVTRFYTQVMQNLGHFVEENFMHDMAHASLDWDEPNGSKQQFDIADDKTLIPHRGVLNKNEWVTVAREDDYFVSYYAKENPEREDIAESIIQYLVLRWRPERFDPFVLKFIEETIPGRISYLDQFDWQFPK